MFKVREFALLLTFLSLIALAQDDSNPKQQRSSDVPLFQLQDAFTQEVPFAGVDVLTIPILCSTDGTSFVQLARDTGLGDIVAIAKDGKDAVQFGSSKINDISQPIARNFAVADADLYLLVTGRIPENKVLTFKKPNGEIFQQSAARSENYIAHFKKDGSYLGAIRLDIPFEPLQIGVFAGGDFLIAGYEKGTFKPRIALARSNGQFQRLLNLPGDLHRSDDQPPQSDSQDKKNADPTALPGFGKTMKDSLWGALNLSMIIADERKLLLVRPGYSVPVFSVSPGGEVTAINLEMPANYALADLKTGNRRWVGIYTQKREDGNGLEIETVVHHPVTGKIIARYAYPRPLGLAVGCLNQNQISFLTTQDGKLILNTLSIPASESSKEAP